MSVFLDQQLIEQLRAQAAQLESQFSATTAFLRCSQLSQRDGKDPEASIDGLQRENTALRKRLAEFSTWEYQLSVHLGRERSAPAPVAASGQPAASRTDRIGLKMPLSVSECHASTRKDYEEILRFSASGRTGYISTGASVFGWADQRLVDNGLLKFCLSKLDPRLSPEAASAKLWTLLVSPGSYAKIHSQGMNMRSEILQVVDHSNVVLWQEYQVRGTTGSGVPTVTVVRALVLVTLFVADSGYIVLTHALDPSRARTPPDDYYYQRDGHTIVNYVWLPVFCWAALDRVDGAENQCLVSFVGTLPVVGANFMDWAVEVLLMVLRTESLISGPLWTLPQQE